MKAQVTAPASKNGPARANNQPAFAYYLPDPYAPI
jgi:hypothetical protein